MESPRPRHPKYSTACHQCRLKKIKCNGGNPCPNCTDHGRICTYPPSQRRNSRRSSGVIRSMQERLAKMEALLPTIQEPPTQNAWHPRELTTFESGQITFLANPTMMNKQRGQPRALVPTNSMESSANANANDPEPLQASLTSSLPEHVPNIALIDEATQQLAVPPELVSPPEDEELGSFNPPEEEIDYEYYGPGAFNGICSKSAIRWVIQKTNVPNFAEMAKNFNRHICRGMRLDQQLNREGEPEPDQDTAWRYSQAYFDETDDSLFGTVCRTKFEARLREHFGQQALSQEQEEPAWYALRNVVYATGARFLLSKDDKPGAFARAYQRGWRYFQNALSVFTDLLFVKTNLLAVQALAAMMFYAEGIQTPELNQLLCSNAIRLAESKGLHRNPATAWNLDNADLQSRRYIWWAIYCYDVQLSLRSGRPLAADNSNITCQLPTEAITGSTVKLEIVIHAIQHARMTSEIAKMITALKTSRSRLADVVTLVAKLDRAVQKWEEKLPVYVRSQTPMLESNVPPGIRACEAVYLKYAYCWSIIQVHSLLFWPWNGNLIEISQDERDLFCKEIDKSTTVVVEASRNLIRQLGHAVIRCSTPKWMVVFSPLLALVNLFIHVIQNPNLPSADTDISLMYVVAGHFSYYEYATSGRGFSFPHEISHLARSTVLKAREKRNLRGCNHSPSPIHSETGVDMDRIEQGGLLSVSSENVLSPNDNHFDEAWIRGQNWSDADSWMDILYDGHGENSVIV